MQVKTHQSLAELSEELWSAIEAADFPFADYRFLRALELSSSVGPDTGWVPLYFTCWDESQLVGALYTYIKTDSYGEYIFDWGWAEGAQRAQIPYYPKLVAAIPFTPATGPKFLIHPKADSALVQKNLIQAFKDLLSAEALHSLHLLFITDDEEASLKEAGFEIRYTHQFHWRNRDYRDFDDFLFSLKQKRSKEIKRERRSVAEAPLRIECLNGEALLPQHAEEAYALYITTIEKKWGQDYLTKDFFRRLFLEMKESIYFFRASNESGELIGGSLALQKGQKLYGRYWGAFYEIKNLHFELCYYQLIELAIAKGLSTVEAGAQGPHKMARGFLPEITKSAHLMKHPSLHRGVTEFISQERQSLLAGLEQIRDQLPFRDSKPESFSD